MPGKKYLRKRNQCGNALSEFGPAMWILLLFIFLPMVNILSLAVSYMLCLVLNYNQVHEAALIPSIDAIGANGVVKKHIPDQWMAGMGKFTNLDSYPQTDVGYRDGINTGISDDKIVSVRTTVVCNPLLTIPLPVVYVPGINGPMPFAIYSERPMENPDYAGNNTMPAATPPRCPCDPRWYIWYPRFPN